jgi:hypothetical protein
MIGRVSKPLQSIWHLKHQAQTGRRLDVYYVSNTAAILYNSMGQKSGYDTGALVSLAANSKLKKFLNFVDRDILHCGRTETDSEISH